ncbi:MAG: transcriptional activator, Baf family protein [Burkholderiaceae bacterium]|nr:transcriptional activator, Baf family protein [Burkholderiaceae bacterium]
MLLLVDAGNTMIKWAIAGNSPGDWRANGTVALADIAQLETEWRAGAISRALISNVAGKARRSQLEKLLVGLPAGSIEWFASAPELAGVRNGYRNPAQLGCDRFAAMIGAHGMFPGQPLIVATCGTATTIDAVTADGLFVGGMILPGLGLMASSLARNTANLPQVAQDSLQFTPFASNTNDAIASGCIAAQIGAIEHAAALHAKRCGSVLCVLSGGAAASVAPHLSVAHRIVDNLVLMGLHTAAQAG